MMKKWAAGLCLILAAVFFSPPVWAAETPEQAANELLQEEFSQLLPLIPEKGADVLEDENLSRGDLSKITPGALLKKLLDAVFQEIHMPLRLFGTLCGVLLISAMFGIFAAEMQRNNCGKALKAAGSMCASAIMMQTVLPLIQDTSMAINGLHHFMIGFIPVFGSVLTVSGRPASAIVYQSVTFGAAQIFAGLADRIIVPFAGIFLAVCVAGSMSEGLDIQSLAGAARNLASWILGLCLTVFVALLTLQSLASGAADTVGSRALKFVISSSIPVVGGALSEAYSSLSGCLGLVKSAVGIFGIIVMTASFMPSLLKIGLCMLALNLAAAVGEILGEKQVCSLIRAVSSGISILGGLIICYGMMILSSSAILLWMGTPV